MNWNQLTDEQKFWTLRTMMVTGGGFAGRLAEAWQRADSGNSHKLGEAFPEMVEKYGPTSDLYMA